MMQTMGKVPKYLLLFDNPSMHCKFHNKNLSQNIWQGHMLQKVNLNGWILDCSAEANFPFEKDPNILVRFNQNGITSILSMTCLEDTVYQITHKTSPSERFT